ncbi:glutathione S-transferase family protein [Pusillimonas sp.]|uniref:glutathione S-transferase family protein n=1 Tax=Pusillimonas sp. TaxID=3040095 RepID=UPI0037C7716A
MPASIHLYGSPISTYYNKVKIALLEYGLPFEQIEHAPGAGQWPESGSPSGKIPFLRHGDDLIYESQAIIEYLEDIRDNDAPSLFPAQAAQRAHCRELILYIELYLDAPMRPIYQSVFWGKEMPAGLLERTLTEVERGLLLLKRRAILDPWLCGAQFTHADSAGWVHLTTIQWALAIAGHKTFMEEHAPWLSDYLNTLAQRPSIAHAEADRRETSKRIKAERAAAKGG